MQTREQDPESGGHRCPKEANTRRSRLQSRGQELCVGGWARPCKVLSSVAEFRQRLPPPETHPRILIDLGRQYPGSGKCR